MSRLGILGGTFDPVHLGHLASAHDTRRAFELDRVLLVLSARPPHKPDAKPAAVEHRMAMLQLAVADDPQLEASAIETERPGPSYTYDTLTALAARHPGAELYLIVGIDAYREIDTWHRPGDILEVANVIVTTRPGQPFPTSPPKPPIAGAASCCYDSDIGCYVHSSGHVVIAHRIDGLDASASEIRRRIDQGLPFEHLTGLRVAEYIRAHRLYGAEPR